jgi:hypothetical protein
VLCVCCQTPIVARDSAYFVEEEVGRLFCSEQCIIQFFRPEIQTLEKLYFKTVLPTELSADVREAHAHLRWRALESPSEAYEERLPSGDRRYTFVAEGNSDGERTYGVSVCLMLRGEPSFLFIAFVTRHRSLVDAFCQGRPVTLTRESHQDEPASPAPRDRLADDWTADDSARASLVQHRSENDIPEAQFPDFEDCLEGTLQDPSELWQYEVSLERNVYHFIKEYTRAEKFWYVVIARDAEDPAQIELVDAFPTRDADLVERARAGMKRPLPSEGGDADMHEYRGTGTSGRGGGKGHLH